MKKTLFFIFSLIASPINASSINFNEPENGQYNSFISEDLTFSIPHIPGLLSSGASIGSLGGGDNNVMSWDSGENIPSFFRTDGSAFNLSSIDMALFASGTFPSGSTGSLTVRGTLFESENVVSRTVKLVEGNSLELITFDSSFNNLESVTIFGSIELFPIIDNIVTDDASIVQTPIPAAVWLFGSGFIGLVGLKRKIN